MPDLTARRWSRRSVLALTAAAIGSLVARTPARGEVVTVGGFSFTVPDLIRQVNGPQSVLGQGWQWLGRGDMSSTDRRVAPVVMARADLDSVDPQEVIGLLLAGATAGRLPDLQLGPRRVRSMPGGGEQTRHDIRYAAAAALPFHGTVLVATRPEPPAALLVVVGGEDLTAGTIDGILDSARWQS